MLQHAEEQVDRMAILGRIAENRCTSNDVALSLPSAAQSKNNHTADGTAKRLSSLKNRVTADAQETTSKLMRKNKQTQNTTEKEGEG
jgi:hypothetical protein